MNPVEGSRGTGAIRGIPRFSALQEEPTAAEGTTYPATDNEGPGLLATEMGTEVPWHKVS
jgi:hypothetical protein